MREPSFLAISSWLESRFDTLRDYGDVKDMVPLEVLVILDLAAKVRSEEEEEPKEDSKTDTDCDTNGDTDAGLSEIRLGYALENNIKNLDSQSNTKVGRNGNQSATERVVVLENKVLCEQEEHGADNTRGNGGNDPGQDNRRDTIPLNVLESKAEIPAPAMEPTTAWVVKTGRPLEEANRTHVAEPIKAQTMVSWNIGNGRLVRMLSC